MRTVEVTRIGDAPVLDQLAEMRQWLRQEGIEAVELEPVRVLHARVRFRATFGNAEQAERFCHRFDAGQPGDL